MSDKRQEKHKDKRTHGICDSFVWFDLYLQSNDMEINMNFLITQTSNKT